MWSVYIQIVSFVFRHIFLCMHFSTLLPTFTIGMNERTGKSRWLISCVALRYAAAMEADWWSTPITISYHHSQAFVVLWQPFSHLRKDDRYKQQLYDEIMRWAFRLLLMCRWMFSVIIRSNANHNAPITDPHQHISNYKKGPIKIFT